MIDKLKLYRQTDPAEEELEGDEVAMMDGDEEATDPQVDAQELLTRMKWLICRIPPVRRKCKKANDLVKTEGEGDWGGECDLESQDTQAKPVSTDWLEDFSRTGPTTVLQWTRRQRGGTNRPARLGTPARTQHKAYVCQGPSRRNSTGRGRMTSLPVQERI